MLRQRVITALLLAAVFLPCLLVPVAWPFAVFTLVAISAASWEWSRLNLPGRPRVALASAAAMAGVCALSLWRWPQGGPPAQLWWIGTGLWVLGGAWLLRHGPQAWPRLAVQPRWLAGLGLLWLAWAALVHGRTLGANFLLSVMCVVVASDISAYFAGRAFGRRKLAPTISPGKSWEGVYGGVAGVALLAVCWLWVERQWPLGSASVFQLMLQRGGAGGLAATALLLTAMGVMGDLIESLAKRGAGVKDSSALLPGHGGVLDRIDALLPALPAALALITW